MNAKKIKKVAAIQMCSTCQAEENLETASDLLKKAALMGADLVVLPEMFPLIGIDSDYKLSIKETLGDGKIQSFLSDHASNLGIWIVGGAIPIACQNYNKVNSMSIVFNEKGLIVGNYSKVHLFDARVSENEFYQESNTVEPGNKLTVIDTPIGKLGMSICYDIRFPTLYNRLRDMGAEIITVPSAFPVATGKAHWKLLARSRAVENFCYIVGACQGGRHASGRITYGHSLIIEPWGNVITEVMKPGKAVICAEIDLEKLHALRAAIPVHKHQKISTMELT